jgi:hypothetical protein
VLSVTELNESFALKDSGVSNGDQAATLPRHRWYDVKEAFSPRLVSSAIEDAECEKGDLVFDPFCGSGTVPLTAASHGLNAEAVEVNPFLAFLARSKLLQPGAKALANAVSRVAESKSTHSPLEGFSTFSKRKGKAKGLFQKSVLRAFEGAWLSTVGLESSVRDVLRVCLTGAAMDVCNATRDGKCLRYRPERLEETFGRAEFVAAFKRRTADVAKDIDAVPLGHVRSRILLDDSRAVLGRKTGTHVRLTVTSPPYLNSFDYSDVYRPELFLGRFVRSNEALMNEVRLRTLRSHVQANWTSPTRSDFGGLYTQAAAALKERADQLWSHRIPLMVQAYFEDIEKILKGLHRRTVKDGSLWVVVSTSAYAGVEIPVDLIIADIGARNGWSLREVGVLRNLRTAGQHWGKWSGPPGQRPTLRESVVIFDRSPDVGKARRRGPRMLAAAAPSSSVRA